MNFKDTWRNIISHAGEEFFTKRNLAFRYKIINNSVVPDRTNYPLSKANFQKLRNLSRLMFPGKSVIWSGDLHTFSRY